MSPRVDVVVVGAGAAGLSAARWLCRAGVSVLLLDAADRPGGRIGTDLVDGYLIDRGFQVVNTAYPALRALLDVDRLGLGLFDHGVVVRTESGRRRLADPRHHPGALLGALRSSIGVADLARLARVALYCGYQDVATVAEQPDVPAELAWSAQLDGAVLTTLVAPFLTGVLGPDPLRTSSRVLAMIVRSFVRGRVGIPAGGMIRLVELLAKPLPAGVLQLGLPVEAVRGTHVRTAAGTIAARAVVVATDPSTAGGLLPGLDVPAERVLVTTYHAATAAPIGRPILLLDGTGRTGIANSVVLTNAASGYAPPGRHLVATTAPAEARLDEPAVRRAAAHLYGVATDDWRHVATVRASPGLVAAPPPHPLRCPVVVGDGVYVAGDHRDTPSLQGALVSGHRAARAVLAHLGAARTGREATRDG